jgi:hypothetical protein
MRAIHQAASSTPTRSDLETLAGVPGYATGGLVSAMTRPAAGGQGAQRGMVEAVERVEQQISNQTRRLEQMDRHVEVDRRTARDIQDRGQEYDQLKNPTDR